MKYLFFLALFLPFFYSEKSIAGHKKSQLTFVEFVSGNSPSLPSCTGAVQYSNKIGGKRFDWSKLKRICNSHGCAYSKKGSKEVTLLSSTSSKRFRTTRVAYALITLDGIKYKPSKCIAVVDYYRGSRYRGRWYWSLRARDKLYEYESGSSCPNMPFSYKKGKHDFCCNPAHAVQSSGSKRDHK